jgi:hypothetical protein
MFGSLVRVRGSRAIHIGRTMTNTESTVDGRRMRPRFLYCGERDIDDRVVVALGGCAVRVRAAGRNCGRRAPEPAVIARIRVQVEPADAVNGPDDKTAHAVDPLGLLESGIWHRNETYRTHRLWPLPREVIATLTNAVVAVRGETGVRTEGGDVHGFASSPDALLRRLSVRRARSRQRQLANGLPAPGAAAVRVRRLRLHVSEGAGRVPAFRSAAPQAWRGGPQAAEWGAARRMIGGMSRGVSWVQR